jgi:sugar lactone lactonase YvrE/DNA-binding GntR family transcriptional regulator
MNYLSQSSGDRHRPLARQVYDELHRQILTFQLKPFQMLSEASVSEMLGVSRTPAREALALLAAKHFVDVLPQRGSQVAPLRVADLERSQFMREALEVALLRRAMSLGRHAELASELKREVVLQRTFAELGEKGRFYASDEAFHGLIAEAAGLVDVSLEIQRVKDHMDRFRHLMVAGVDDLNVVIQWRRCPSRGADGRASAADPALCGRSPAAVPRIFRKGSGQQKGQAMMPRILGSVRDGVGESPFWDGGQRAIWSVDITGKRILRRGWPDGATETWDTRDLPTALARSDGGSALVAFAQGVALWQEADRVVPVATLEADPLMRLNEGKCDPRGRFWVASMENNLTEHLSPRRQGAARGRLFRIDGGRAVAMTEAEFGIPNTMAWSPDRARFYLGDSQRNTIWVWDYDDDSGEIANRRVFVTGGPGVPDGSCMDAEGCLWTARFGAGCILRYDPGGQVEREIPLPVRNPTAATFGGTDLSVLFITSARFGLDAPDAADGALLAVETGIRGQEENWYRP